MIYWVLLTTNNGEHCFQNFPENLKEMFYVADSNHSPLLHYVTRLEWYMFPVVYIIDLFIDSIVENTLIS